MPNLDFTQRIDISPERFINACSIAELLELDLLLSKKLQNVTVQDVSDGEQAKKHNGGPFMIKEKDKDL